MEPVKLLVVGNGWSRMVLCLLKATKLSIRNPEIINFAFTTPHLKTIIKVTAKQNSWEISDFFHTHIQTDGGVNDTK